MEPRSDALKRSAASALHHLLLVGGAGGLLLLGIQYNAWLTAATLLGGWLAGSLVEYSVHRFVLHGLALTGRVHARHHASPAQEQIDPISYFGPIVVVVIVWTALRALTGETSLACGFTAGLCLQYSWFRAVHRRLHLPGHRRAASPQARFHHGHHADVRCNFGVTTPIWDKLFQTSRTPETVRGDHA